jgi:GDPmannose 4,6-dehydratase
MRIALITGITGQDGSYLTELLLQKDYIVWGIIRRSSSINTHRIDNLFDNKNLILKYGDLTDGQAIMNILYEIKNKYFCEKSSTCAERLEIYNLAAMSHVKISFELPEYTGHVDALGPLRVLNAIIACGMQKYTRFYQASTSEMFGKVQSIPQTENTPFYPRSPYGVAKLYGHWITKNYREAYNMFAVSGILYNHESKRRAHNFVTRKITIGLGKIIRGETDRLVLGNLNSLRDWGHAKDYVRGMYLMLQQESADDYILSTNSYHSVREFVEKAFKLKGIDISWKGEGLNEVGYDKNTGKEYIFVSEKYFRPTEVDELLGDCTKAHNNLKWQPEISFDELVHEMVENDCS